MRIWISAIVLPLICNLAAAQRAYPPAPGSPVLPAPQTESPAQLLSRTNGSLLRATALTPPQVNQANLSGVSFFAVPEPEPKTLHKHDLVTIVVREESEYRSEGTNDLKRSADFDALLAAYFRLRPNNAQIIAAGQDGAQPELNFSGERNFKGEASHERSDSFILRVTAEVVDVKPNGNLVLQARQRIKHDEEEQMFVLSGTCRAEDILPDNTVLSTQMFDTDLNKHTKGDVRQTTRRGWFPKLLDVISPF